MAALCALNTGNGLNLYLELALTDLNFSHYVWPRVTKLDRPQADKTICVLRTRCGGQTHPGLPQAAGSTISEEDGARRSQACTLSHTTEDTPYPGPLWSPASTSRLVGDSRSGVLYVIIDGG